MARQTERLSSAKVKHAKIGMHADGGGLYLQVTASRDGSQLNKSWLFRFAREGKERQMGLGSLNTIGLSEARDEAERCRKLLREGRDPIEARNATRAAGQVAEAKTVTFEWCAVAYMAAHEAGWRNAQHRQQWTNTLTDYAYPIIGKLPVDVIDTTHIMQILKPLWMRVNPTAMRLRGRIAVVLDWAKVNGHRRGENCARWKGHLDHLLPAPSKIHKGRHRPALPWKRTPEFTADLRLESGFAPRCLEFMILTAARVGEARGTLWSEIDVAAKIWTVPGHRMKGGREHRVPLSERALEILEYMRAVQQNDFVFPGETGSTSLSEAAIIAVTRRMNRARKKDGKPLWVDPDEDGQAVVPHGFRASFRTWVSEATDFPGDLAEAALAHINGDKVENAYRRGVMLEKRRKLMTAWAEFCGAAAGGAAVAPLQAAE